MQPASQTMIKGPKNYTGYVNFFKAFGCTHLPKTVKFVPKRELSLPKWNFSPTGCNKGHRLQVLQYCIELNIIIYIYTLIPMSQNNMRRASPPHCIEKLLLAWQKGGYWHLCGFVVVAIVVLWSRWLWIRCVKQQCCWWGVVAWRLCWHASRLISAKCGIPSRTG